MQNAFIKQFNAYSKYLVIGAAALVFTSWMVITPPGLLGKLDAIAYAVCHRLAAHSLFMGAIQMPLCARCTGMYLGAMAGLVFQTVLGWKRSKAPHWSIIALLIAFVVAFGIDGANSYLGLLKQIHPGALPQIPNLYTPNNTLRVLTGSGMGLVIAVMLFPAFNQSVWSDYNDKRSALPGWKAFGLLLGIQAALDLLVLTGSPVVLYPVAFISVLGVIVLLTMVYAILWVMLTGQDNKYTRLRQLWLPLLAGFTITMIQTTGIDMLRFWLTGTWGGLPL